MEVLFFYAIFAVATALTSLYEIMHPVIQEQTLLEGKVNDEFLIYFTFFIMCLILAPLLFIACIVPSIGIESRTFLRKGLFEQE